MMKRGRLIENDRGDTQSFYAVFFFAMVLVAVMIMFGLCVFYTETEVVTIEHKWIENNNYYFSDTNDLVYKLGYVDDTKYSNMPNIRYEKLEVGKRYIIEHLLKSCCGTYITVMKEEEIG